MKKIQYLIHFFEAKNTSSFCFSPPPAASSPWLPSAATSTRSLIPLLSGTKALVSNNLTFLQFSATWWAITSICLSRRGLLTHTRVPWQLPEPEPEPEAPPPPPWKRTRRTSSGGLCSRFHPAARAAVPSPRAAEKISSSWLSLSIVSSFLDCTPMRIY